MQVETQEELNTYKKYAFRFSRTYQINLIYVESTTRNSQMKFVEIGADNVAKVNRQFTYAIYKFTHNGKVILILEEKTIDSYRFFEKTMLFEFMKRGATMTICKLKRYIDI